MIVVFCKIPCSRLWFWNGAGTIVVDFVSICCIAPSAPWLGIKIKDWVPKRLFIIARSLNWPELFQTLTWIVIRITTKVMVSESFIWMSILIITLWKIEPENTGFLSRTWFIIRSMRNISCPHLASIIWFRNGHITKYFSKFDFNIDIMK